MVISSKLVIIGFDQSPKQHVRTNLKLSWGESSNETKHEFMKNDARCSESSGRLAYLVVRESLREVTGPAAGRIFNQYLWRSTCKLCDHMNGHMNGHMNDHMWSYGYSKKTRHLNLFGSMYHMYLIPWVDVEHVDVFWSDLSMTGGMVRSDSAAETHL